MVRSLGECKEEAAGVYAATVARCLFRVGWRGLSVNHHLPRRHSQSNAGVSSLEREVANNARIAEFGAKNESDADAGVLRQP